MRCSPARGVPSCSGRCAPASRRPRRCAAALRTCTSCWPIGERMQGRRPPGVEAVPGRDDPELLAGADLLVKSPGVPEEAAIVRAARSAGIPVWAEVELAYRLLEERNPIVGITGTNGKTTTTLLTAAMLERGGVPARQRRQRRHGALVARRHRRARAHDRVRALELPAGGRRAVPRRRGRAAQRHARPPRPPRLVRALRGGQAARVRAPARERHRRPVRRRRLRRRARRRRPARRGPAGARLGQPSSGRSRRPSRPRCCAARTTAPTRPARSPSCARSGPTRPARRPRCATSPRPPHRLEQVRELRGVRYVNDSKATNVEATLQALASFDAPLHVILGGSLKGADFAPLARAAGAQRRPPSYLIGEAAPELRRAFTGTGIELVDSGTLERAVAHRGLGGRRGRRRAALAGLRLLRPVPRLRGARRALPRARRGARVSRARTRGARRRAAARDRRHGARRLRRRHGLLGLGLVHAARAPRGLRRRSASRRSGCWRARTTGTSRRWRRACSWSRRCCSCSCFATGVAAQRRAALAEPARRLHAAALRARQGGALRVRRGRARRPAPGAARLARGDAAGGRRRRGALRPGRDQRPRLGHRRRPGRRGRADRERRGGRRARAPRARRPSRWPAA